MSQISKVWIAAGAVAVVVLGISLMSVSSARAFPPGGEQIENGSFETGSFSGWTTETTGDPFEPWDVEGAGDGSGFFPPTDPQDGDFDAWNGFDGGGPMQYRLWQDVSIPAGGPATLSWSERVQWDYGLTSDATAPRVHTVEIVDPLTNATLATLHSFSTPLDFVLGDTGWQSYSVDITEFAGQTVRIMFRQVIPESFTGPGQFELDAVSLVTAGDNTPPEASYVVERKLLNGSWTPFGGYWSTSQVRVVLSCEDEGSGVFDQFATRIVNFTADGEFVFDPESVPPCEDKAGNEADMSLLPDFAFGVDKAAPVCTVAPASMTIPPEDGAPLVAVVFEVTTSDATSGAGATVVSKVTGTDGATKADWTKAGLWAIGVVDADTFEISGEVRATKNGALRRYDVTFRVTDAAGNTGSCLGVVKVK